MRNISLKIIKTLVFCLLLLTGSERLLANEIDDDIASSQVTTYDCPEDEDIKKLESYLAKQQASAKQGLEIQVIKAQGLICIGQYLEAKTLLESLLSDPLMEKQSRSYASIVYQIGFILDVQEDGAQCSYYKQAQSLSHNKFNDINLSAQLGQITVCDQEGQDMSVKLGRLYTLLEQFMLKGDDASVAHIHNNIGLLYGDIGQNVLAAEQYEKSYEIGLKVYEPKNQVAPLISVISAHMGSGDFAKANKMIEELAKANLIINTPLTNSWLHYAQSRYFYQLGDYELMRNSMWKWAVYLPLVSNKQMDALYQWYAAALCVVDKDKKCVMDYLQLRALEDIKNPSRLSKNKDYLRFLVEANLFLENIEQTTVAFQQYASILAEKLREQQSSGRILGVAKLHGEVVKLEASLVKIEKQHIQSIAIILLVVGGIFLLAYYTLGRKYLRKLGTDSLTGLRNEQSVLNEIKRVHVPVAGKINALAVFDLTNFTSVNTQFGYLAGEQLLKKVASCLIQVTRENDIVGRLGHDQFIVCLKNLDDDTAKELFQRIQKVLTELVFNVGSGKLVNVHSSMSMYLDLDGFNDLEQIIEDMRHAHHTHKPIQN